MPIPNLEHVKGYYVAKDIWDQRRTVGFTLRAHPNSTFKDLKEMIDCSHPRVPNLRLSLRFYFLNGEEKGEENHVTGTAFSDVI